MKTYAKLLITCLFTLNLYAQNDFQVTTSSTEGAWPALWVPTFVDEFDGKDQMIEYTKKIAQIHQLSTENIKKKVTRCYDVEEPVCYVHPQEMKLCKDISTDNYNEISAMQFLGSTIPNYNVQTHFRNLNKCVWQPWAYPNYMGDGDYTKTKPTVNGFHPRMVEVDTRYDVSAGCHFPDTLSQADFINNHSDRDACSHKNKSKKGALVLRALPHNKLKSPSNKMEDWLCYAPSENEYNEANEQGKYIANYIKCPMIVGGLSSRRIIREESGWNNYDLQQAPDLNLLNTHNNPDFNPLSYLEDCSNANVAGSVGQKCGYDQLYGRFEVRLKIAKKQAGNWPAAWLIPRRIWRPRQTLLQVPYLYYPDEDPNNLAEVKSGSGWPQTVEIDMLEQWDRNRKNGAANYHFGDMYSTYKPPGEELPNYVERMKHLRIGHGSKEMGVRKKINPYEFNIYGFEWGPTAVRFTIDDRVILTIAKNDLPKLAEKIVGKKDFDKYKSWWKKTYKKEKFLPLFSFPLDDPFYWILNFSVVPFGDEDNEFFYNNGDKTAGYNFSSLRNLEEREYVIDYVRNYRNCTEDDRLNDQSNPSNTYCHLRTMNRDRSEGVKVAKENANADITIYPNPVRKNTPFNVQVSLSQPCERGELSILSTAGQMIHSRRIEFNQSELDLNFQISGVSSPSGSYFVRLALNKCTKEGKIINGINSRKFLVID